MKLPVVPVHSFEDATLDLEQLQKTLTIPAWTAPTLINTWANTGGANEKAGYLKDGLGFVHLKGVIQTGASGTVAFVLPAGYRPGATTSHAAINGALSEALVQIAANGNVTVFNAGVAANPIGLSGITFLAEN